jgi:hypothetical protein
MACKNGRKLDEVFADSVRERESAEEDLRSDEGTFLERWERFEKARDRWSAYLREHVLHMRECRIAQ